MQIREISKNLELTNSGTLSIFPIGSGSAFTKKNYQNNYVLIKGDEHLMIDCGTRTPEALFTLGHPITDIRNFLITHSHADHIGGLEEVILMNRYITGKKPEIVITKEYQKLLWNNSLKGGAAWNETKQNGYLEFSDYFEPQYPEKFKGMGKRKAYEINYRGFNIIMFRTMHYPDTASSWKDSAYSIGLIIDRKIFFSGDTRYDRDLIDTVSANFPIEYYFHDVQFFPGGVHAPFDDIVTLDESIRNRMFLMHYPDTYQDHEGKILDAGFAGFVQQQKYYDFD